MSSTRSAYTGHGVIDLEAGPVDDAAIKAAGLVAEKFYDAMEQTRIGANLSDRVLEDDTSRNRAARDRDRAFPRDTSTVEHDRKRRQLPDRGEFRGDLSSRQRKERSAAKHRVHATAPQTQMREMSWVIRDPERWQHLNSSLRQAVGDARALDERDRRSVQRIDRLIQSYERDSGRGHVVYAVIELPTDTAVMRRRDVPATLQPGARISFDQYTMATHTLHEAAAVAARRRAEGSSPAASTVILEIETSRGMYLGRSDSVDDTSHILPRGLGMRVAGIDEHAGYARPGGHGSTLVAQLRDTPRDPGYQPPVTGRRLFNDRRAAAAARAAARDTKEP